MWYGKLKNMKICVDNDNFESAITSLKTKSFFNENITYRFLYDGLRKKYKTYLLENDLDKNRILIYLTKDKKNKEIIKKYKHQIIIFESKKLDIRQTLNEIFRGKLEHKILITNLSKFDNRHILTWLESTAATSYIVARKMSEIDKYVYSPYFKHLVVYNLFGCGATAQWMKK